MTWAHARILNLVLVVVLVSESKALYFQIVRRYSLVVYGRKIVGLVPQFCLWNVKDLTLGRTGRIPPTFDGLVWYRSWDTSSVNLLSFNNNNNNNTLFTFPLQGLSNLLNN